MKNIIFIGGINGVGKSTIGKMLSIKLGCPFYEGSSLLMQELGIEGNYDKLRNTEELKTKEALLSVFYKISSQNNLSVIVSHYIKIIDGNFNLYSGNWFNYCKYNVHLTANPELIFQRILEDEKDGRDRRLFSNLNKTEKILFIKKAQDFSLKSWNELSLTFGINKITVQNNSSNLNSTVNKIYNFLDESF